MAKDSLELTDDKTLAYVCAGLQDHLGVAANGYKCTTEDLIQVLIAMASQRTTLEDACTLLPGTPDATTIRDYLNAQLTTGRLPELESQVNAALQAQIPRRVWHKQRDIALDTHERPYYGKVPQEQGLWVYSRPKASTKRFYRIATACVMHKGLRSTLAVKFMPPEETALAAVKALLTHVEGLEIPVRALWMDKGFATVAIMRYVRDKGLPAIIACPIRGKPGGQGTRALCTGRKSYCTSHEFESRDHQRLTVKLAVCRVYEIVRRKGRKQRQAAWQIFIIINSALPLQQIRARYRARFGIETSYRCANQVRGWTTSPNPAYRFLLMALAFYVYNVWVRLHWLYTQVPRRGGRYLCTSLFRLARLKSFLLHALESRYGSVSAITAPAAPRL